MDAADRGDDVVDDGVRHPVDILAEEYAERLRRGERPAISEYEKKHPEYASLIRTVFESIATVERISSQKLSDSATFPQTARQTTPQVLGDFQILREIGRGGMGVVYEAIQQSLHRRVALKVINAAVSTNDQHRTRFQREAESAAGLHHTNIVQVYGSGEEQGIQYYAMQLIDGVTLSDVIQCLRSMLTPNAANTKPIYPTNRFSIRDAANYLLETTVSHRNGIAASKRELESKSSFRRSSRNQSTWAGGKTASEEQNNAPPFAEEMTLEMHQSTGDVNSSSEQPVAPASSKANPHSFSLPKNYIRNVAKLIANVANALEYAHRQQVLHRDIKPANLLLDKEGTVWITDFGLARRMDLDSATQTGEVLGTLRYMAPEQIAGGGDARIDIYSLGICLFELLTLTPAFEAPKLRLLDPNRHSVLQTSPLRNSLIPRDLQTITLKACAIDPEHRYRNASEFELDLRLFLEDRPIRARKTTQFEALTRWARRNPAIASLAALSGIMLVSIACMLAVWNRQQHLSLIEIGDLYEKAETNLREKSKALDDVKKEKSRAEANLALATNAFDAIFDNIASRGSTLASTIDFESEELDLSGTALSEADVDLLESLLSYFEQLGEKNSVDLRDETADAWKRVGDIQQKMGKLDESHESYEKALLLLQTIAKHANFDSTNGAGQRLLLSQIGVLQEMIQTSAMRGRMMIAIDRYKEARTLIESSGDLAKSSEGRFALAKLINSIGSFSARVQRPNGPRVPNGPLSFFGPPDSRGAEGRTGPGLLPAADMRARIGTELNQEALSILKELVEESPDKASYAVSLARALRDEVRFARQRGDRSEAEQALSRSLSILESLVTKNPEARGFQYELAETLVVTSGWRPQDAENLDRALHVCDELLKASPYNSAYLALKATALSRMSMAQRPANRNRSLELLLQATLIQQDLMDRFPDVPIYSMNLVESLIRLTELEPKPLKAKEHLDRAFQIVASRGGKGVQNKLTPYLERLKERRRALDSAP
ncbi:MAG: protein kinase domain-containing protein [Pirellula sp.]|nr:protein kinase [Pirellula sp.]